MWTHFWDMHSGGGTKIPPYESIFIEAPKEEATLIFYNRYGHSPNRVSCTCCGGDYSISSHESLAQLTGFHRKCRTLVVPQDEKGLYQNDDPVIVAHLYLEEDEVPPDGYTVKGLPQVRLGSPEEPADRDRLAVALTSRGYQTLEDYMMREDVDLILAQDIRTSDRQGVVPDEGYVWVG